MADGPMPFRATTFDVELAIDPPNSIRWWNTNIFPDTRARAMQHEAELCVKPSTQDFNDKPASASLKALLVLLFKASFSGLFLKKAFHAGCRRILMR
eukprot:4250157-Ditylum_brightwellii.AAC.1